MILNKLEIHNFRCFKDYEIDFAPRVTVLFGKNGSGKSTLINALHKALSFTMHSVIIKDKTSKAKRPKVLEVQDITDGNPYVCVEGISKFGDEHVKGVKRGDYTIDIHAEAMLTDGKPIDWSVSAYAKNGGKRPSEYKKAFSELYQYYKETGTRPLLAFYSDVYPFLTAKKTVSKHEKGKFTYLLTSDSPGMAYTEWNDESGITNKWIERLETKLRNRMHLHFITSKSDDTNHGGTISAEEKLRIEEEAAEVENEINAITSCLRTFTCDDISGLPLQVKKLDFTKYDYAHLHVYPSEGEPIAFRDLPAGYLRLYSIVLDLAYRSYILSDRKNTDVPGIVLIDEIDLHLHPELEQSVLQRLTKTFPSIQFIISTHSPLVLTKVSTADKKNTILRMEPRNINMPNAIGQRKPVPSNELYGLDYNTSVQEGMDVSSGDEELEWAISECVFMLRNNMAEPAEVLKQQILEKNRISAEELDRRIYSSLNK